MAQENNKPEIHVYHLAIKWFWIIARGLLFFCVALIVVIYSYKSVAYLLDENNYTRISIFINWFLRLYCEAFDIRPVAIVGPKEIANAIGYPSATAGIGIIFVIIKEGMELASDILKYIKFTTPPRQLGIVLLKVFGTSFGLFLTFMGVDKVSTQSQSFANEIQKIVTESRDDILLVLSKQRTLVIKGLDGNDGSPGKNGW